MALTMERDPFHNFSGLHLPRGPKKQDTSPLPPPEGCYNGCGETELLMDLQLVYRGRVIGHWMLCAECYEWGQQGSPLPVDPLTVGAA